MECDGRDRGASHSAVRRDQRGQISHALRRLDSIQPDERESAGVETALRRERSNLTDGVVFNAVQDYQMGRSFKLDRIPGPDAALDLIAAFEKAARAIVAVAAHVPVAVDDRYRVASPCRSALGGKQRLHGRFKAARYLTGLGLRVLNLRLLRHTADSRYASERKQLSHLLKSSNR
jgi:hypothetical protein